MALNFAALHTAAIGSLKSLLDIVATDPSCSAGIVEEVTRMLHSGEWTKAKLDRCHRGRSRPVGKPGCPQKKVLPFSDLKNGVEGWFAPQGSYIAIDMHNAQHDPSIYPDPETYHAFRLSRPLETVQDEKDLPVTAPFKYQRTNYQRNFPAFGTRPPCLLGEILHQGEIKLMLAAYMLMRYVIEPLAVGSVNQWLGGIGCRHPNRINLPNRVCKSCDRDCRTLYIFPLKFTHAFLPFATRVI
ncbi:MAG: hypothetical protein Q9172_006274 [Xanthocarpia lactea]